MKKILKYLTIVLFVGVGLNSCETTDLKLQVSPNDLAEGAGDPNLLLNAIQLSYTANIHELSDIGGELTRIDYMLGRNYFNVYTGDTFNDIWARTYSSEWGSVANGNIYSSDVDLGISTNLTALEDIKANSDIDYSFHVAVGKTLQAHMLLLIVDYLGTATFSEAGQPEEFPAPMMDDGAAVYAGALTILDEAEALFNTDPGTVGAIDFFYNGDNDKWLKLINTIRLKAYVTTGDVSNFNAVIADDNFIATAEDNFVWQYGTSELQPNNRHPDYQLDYTTSGAGIYQSNWLMELMLDNNDPRIRYYFYRQVDATPGAAGEPADEERLACSLATVPQHYIDGGFTYCSVPNGYWGRSHGNNEGTPPDGFQRTAVGVYPAAGLFDDSRFEGINLGVGGGGAGIEPIILSSYVDFWRAEMAPDATKDDFLRSGLEKSIAYVQSFAALDGTADLSQEPSETAVTDYIDGIVDDYNAASGDAKMNILAEQYFVTLYGGSAEAYNYYRRTGFPTTLTPNWELDPGPFPRTLLLPQNEVITNPNITQRTNLTTQVFWDTNPSSPTFPAAN